MKQQTRPVLATLTALCLLVAAGSSLAQANRESPSKPGTGITTTKPVTAAPAAAPAHEVKSPRDVATGQASGKRAAAAISASENESSAMAAAVRSKNTNEARSILLRNGMTAKDLEGATIVLEDATGGGSGGAAQRVSVTINVKCCPMVITIIIKF